MPRPADDLLLELGEDGHNVLTMRIDDRTDYHFERWRCTIYVNGAWYRWVVGAGPTRLSAVLDAKRSLAQKGWRYEWAKMACFFLAFLIILVVVYFEFWSK